METAMLGLRSSREVHDNACIRFRAPIAKTLTKGLRSAFFGASALAIGIAALASTASAAELRLLSSFNATQKPTYAVLEQYLANVKSIGGDTIKIAISGPEVVPIFEQLQPVASGVFDMLYTHPVFHAGEGGLALTVVNAGSKPFHSPE